MSLNMALYDFREHLSHLAARPHLAVLAITPDRLYEIEWAAEQIAQKVDDHVVVVRRWPHKRHAERFRAGLTRFGEKVIVREPTSIVQWLADPIPCQRWIRPAEVGLIYVDGTRSTAIEIATRSAAAWPLLAPNGMFVWRDYLSRNQEIKRAVDQVLSDRPHKIIFRNRFLGVSPV